MISSFVYLTVLKTLQANAFFLYCLHSANMNFKQVFVSNKHLTPRASVDPDLLHKRDFYHFSVSLRASRRHQDSEGNAGLCRHQDIRYNKHLSSIKSRLSSSDGVLDQMNGDDVQLAFKTQDLMTEHVTY